MFSSVREPPPSTLSPFSRPFPIGSSPKHTAFLSSIKRSSNPSLRSSTPVSLGKRVGDAAWGPRAILQSSASRFTILWFFFSGVIFFKCFFYLCVSFVPGFDWVLCKLGRFWSFWIFFLLCIWFYWFFFINFILWILYIFKLLKYFILDIVVNDKLEK